MKDDYLWDKTGEPDPEIQHLERVLGQMRHRRTAQDLPPIEIKRMRPRLFSKTLAMAASVAFAALALGAFLVLQRQSKNQNSGPVVMVNLPQQTLEASDGPVKEVEATQKLEPPDKPTTIKAPDSEPKLAALAVRRRSINRSREDAALEREQAAGLLAKEQLIKALQITSKNLDSVQKKVKGDNNLGPSS